MNNNEFLKELNFFKNNPKKTEKFDRSTPLFIIFLAFVGFLFLLLFINVKILTICLCTAIISAFGLSIFIEFKNNRIESFENKVYTGELKDLFGDLESADIKDYLSEITQEIKDYTGVRGSKAISIWNRINSPYIKEQRLKKEKANEQIEEIRKIQEKI